MKEKIKEFLYYNKTLIGLSLVIIICFLIFIFNNKDEVNEEVITSTNDIKESEPINKTIYVDIKGAVKKPGVYEMDSSSRVIDLLKKAKLKKNANTKYINLSKQLTDEMVIVIYTNSEVKNYLNSKSSKSICSIMINNACLSDSMESTESIDSIKDTKTTTKIESNLDTSENKIDNTSVSISNIVNINTASIEELSNLNGIGSSKAKKIVDYRNEHGSFTDTSELMNVSGIGASTYEKIKNSITV